MKKPTSDIETYVKYLNHRFIGQSLESAMAYINDSMPSFVTEIEILGKGDLVTYDWLFGRIRIYVDSTMSIRKFTCG